MLRNLILTATALACLASCTKNTTSNKPVEAPVTSAIKNASVATFPTLSVGNQWKYMVQTQTQSKSNLGDYPTNYTASTTQNYTVTIVSGTTIKKTHVYKITNTLNATLGAYYNYQSGVYDNSINYIAVDSTGSMYMLNNTDGIDTNGLISNAYLMEKFPASVGDSWSSQAGNNVFYSCTLDSAQTVTIPSGSFNCIEVTGTCGNYIANQYYSTKGLVMSYEMVNNTSVGSGTQAYVRLTTLTSVNF